MAEIGIKDAAARLGRSTETVARLAIECSTETAAQRAIHLLKRLPGRKVGRFWLFQPKHVAAFARIKRPVGRPKNG